MNHEQIARVAHEVNRAYCAALGDKDSWQWRENGGNRAAHGINRRSPDDS